MELLSAWSAIEIALWDILGKRTGQTVYNLLGGYNASATGIVRLRQQLVNTASPSTTTSAMPCA